MSHRTALVIVVAAALSVAGYFVLADEYFNQAALFVIFVIGIFISKSRPLVAVFALVFSDIFPTLFSMTPIYREDYGAIGGGLFAVDVVLVCMGCATALKFWEKRKETTDLRGMRIYFLLFCALLSFEIIRNISAYGISAFGEFRFRYLILVLPVYLVALLDTYEARRRVFKSIVYFSVFFTLAFVPVIGILKGWAVGPENRFLPSTVHLGLIYGLLGILMAEKYHLIRASKLRMLVVLPASLLLLVLDSHRSVWVAIPVLVLSVSFLEQDSRRDILKRVAFPVIVFALLAMIVSSSGFDLEDYVAERAGEVFRPGETNETNPAWRIAQWDLQMPVFFASPIFGEGFGGYWGSREKGDVGIFPHNLFVQTLVKLGLTGLILYIIIATKAFLVLIRWLRHNENKNDPEYAFVLTAAAVLLASQMYYTAYSFEYYTWLFVGIGLAVVRDKTARRNESNQERLSAVRSCIK